MAVKAVSRSLSICCWWWDRRTAPIPSGWWKWATISASVRTWSTTAATWIRTGWKAFENVGVTAGASAPEHLVQELIDFLRDHGFHQMEEIELVEEDVRFSLPARIDDFDPMSAPLQVGNTLANRPPNRPCAAPPDRILPGCRRRDGHWCAELTADTTLESDYILFQLWLYPPVNGKWEPETRPLSRQGRPLDSRSPTSRRRLQYLRAGAFARSARR